MKELLAVLIFLFATDGLTAEELDLTNQTLSFNNAVPDSALVGRIDWQASYIMTSLEHTFVARVQCARPKFVNSRKPFKIQLFDKSNSKPLAKASLPMSSDDCFSILKNLKLGTHELKIHTEVFKNSNELKMAIEVRIPREAVPTLEESSFSGGFLENVYRATGERLPHHILTSGPESPNVAIAHCGDPRAIARGEKILYLEIRPKTTFGARVRYEKSMKSLQVCFDTLDQVMSGETRLDVLADGSISHEASNETPEQMSQMTSN